MCLQVYRFTGTTMCLQVYRFTGCVAKMFSTIDYSDVGYCSVGLITVICQNRGFECHNLIGSFSVPGSYSLAVMFDA